MIGAYHAFLAGGTLRRLACRTRPYELEPGATDRRVAEALSLLVDAFENGKNKEAAFREAFEPFRKIPTSPRNKPKVAIFGDFYARDNDVFNQGLEATHRGSRRRGRHHALHRLPEGDTRRRISRG